MNTNEFILALAERLQVSRKDSAKLLQVTTSVVRDTISNEKKVTLLHLGSFQMKKSASRTAYIPALNKKAILPPRRIVRFLVAETLKAKLKNTRQP